MNPPEYHDSRDTLAAPASAGRWIPSGTWWIVAVLIVFSLAWNSGWHRCARVVRCWP